MKTSQIATADRPIKGLVTLVRVFPTATAMKPFGGCASARHLTLPAGFQLDRYEDQVHPGEGSA